ncbi:MAG: hypothetical protein RLZZ301_91 [Bacteroidota bacterium]|jgi:hypothetical protein
MLLLESWIEIVDTKRNISRLLNSAYALMLLLLFLDLLPHFDIKSQALKSFAYLGLLVGTPVLLLWNYFAISHRKQQLFGTLYPSIILIFIIVIGPLHILFASGAWHTQTVLFEHCTSRFKQIEFQLQDKGGLGYNKRTIQVLYITPFFIITSPVPKNTQLSSEWKKVNLDRNELGLKEP